MQDEVLDALLVMARDPDNLVRRTATDVLGHISSREAAEMLMELRRDPSPRVRDAALAALAGLKIAHDQPPASPRKASAVPRSPVESTP
jgi:HEAT repeat protein